MAATFFVNYYEILEGVNYENKTIELLKMCFSKSIGSNRRFSRQLSIKYVHTFSLSDMDFLHMSEMK